MSINILYLHTQCTYFFPSHFHLECTTAINEQYSLLPFNKPLSLSLHLQRNLQLNLNVQPVPELAQTGLDPTFGIFNPLSYQPTRKSNPPPIASSDWLWGRGSIFLNHNILPVWAGSYANQSNPARLSFNLGEALSVCVLDVRSARKQVIYILWWICTMCKNTIDCIFKIMRT